MHRIIYLQEEKFPHTWCNDNLYPDFVNFCYFSYYLKKKNMLKQVLGWI